MPQNLNQWKFAGIVQFSPKSHQVRSGYQFTRSIVKIKASAKVPIGKHWFKAGYLEQNNYQGIRINAASKVIPLNETTIFELSELADRYTLSFCAVPWLLSELRLEIWEDATPQSTELPIDRDSRLIFERILDLEAKVDAL